MPRLNHFKVTIETGELGTDGPVMFTINNHKLPLDNPEGSVDPGATFTGGFEVNSFAHSLTLVGPEQGKWNIKSIKVDYHCDGTPPYSVKFGEVTLDETNEVNIWQDPPLPVYEV